MQPFKYTAQGSLTKSDIIENFVMSSAMIDGADLYGRAGVLVFDESMTKGCDFSSCKIIRPGSTCRGLKTMVKDDKGNQVPQDPNHLDLGESTCTVTCEANNRGNDPIGCGCKIQRNKERCFSRSLSVPFEGNRKPCIVWDEATNQMKINRSITGCKPTFEDFKEKEEEEDDNILPFFDQRMFRPSWIGSSPYGPAK